VNPGARTIGWAAGGGAACGAGGAERSIARGDSTRPADGRS